MTEHEKRIEQIVDNLGCSIAEAEQLLLDDKEIDRNKRMPFDLTKEQEKEALKYANVRERKKPMVLNLPKKERKPDETKEGTIKQLADFLKENGYAEVEITNKTKLIAFKIGEENFELNLVRKRPKKK